MFVNPGFVFRMAAGEALGDPDHRVCEGRVISRIDERHELILTGGDLYLYKTSLRKFQNFFMLRRALLVPGLLLIVAEGDDGAHKIIQEWL